MTSRTAAGIAGLGLLAAGAAAASVITSDHTTGKAATLALAAPTGLAYIASGLVARTRRPDNGTGVLMILVGFAWFFAALPTANVDLFFTIGLALTGVFIGFLAHLLLAFPSGRLSSRVDRVLAATMYAFVSSLPIAFLLFDDGELSNTACETGTSCPDNLLATFDAQPVANAIAGVYGIGVGLLSLAVAVRLWRRRRAASPALRRSLDPILVTAGVLIAGFATQIAVSVFSEPASRAVNWFVLVAMLALPLAFLYGLLRPQLTASTRRVAAELSTKRHPVEVRDVLRRALRDPTLELGHRVEDGTYVDVLGRTFELPTDEPGRAVTPVGHDVIVHDAVLLDEPELADIVDAAQIALERGVSLQSLEASERRAGALLEAIPDNVYRVGEDGTFLEARANKASKIYPSGVVYPGVPAESIVGKTVYEVMPELAEHVMGGVRAALRTDDTALVEFAIPTPIGPRDVELRVAKSGPTDTVGIVRDVTERKQQERELRRLADEQAALSRVAVAVATADHPAALFDVVAEEVGRLLGADTASLVRFGSADERAAYIVGQWNEPGVHRLDVGASVALDGGPLTRVRETGAPARGKASDADVSPALAERLREFGITALVAAPIAVSGAPWGAVVLAVTGDKDFEPDAEERIAQFAHLVAVALANAEARRELAALAQEQGALSRVAVAVATELEPELIFNLVTEEAARLLGARWGSTVRFVEDADEVVVVGDWHVGDDRELELGARFRLGGGAISRVKDTRQPARIEYVLDPDPQPRQMVAAPIVVAGRLWGATTISMPGPETFPPEAEGLGKFTNLVAVALANAEAREQLTASRARIVQAGDSERRRLERNLHDGAQQRLVSLALGLRLAQAKLPGDPEAANALLENASAELALGLEELRELARGIHPAILTDRGLTPALEALADRTSVPVRLHGLPSERLPEPIEAAAFYVVSESLTNVTKYAGATEARVDLARDDGLFVVEVSDDGVGGADPSQGSGLRGLSDRVEALGGRLRVASERGRGTTVRAELPLRDSYEVGSSSGATAPSASPRIST